MIGDRYWIMGCIASPPPPLDTVLLVLSTTKRKKDSVFTYLLM